MSDKGFFKKEFAAVRLKLAVFLPILVIIAVSIPLAYTYLLDILQSNPVPQQLIQQPEQLKDYTYYIWSQWFGKNLMQSGSIVAIIFGAGLIASEVSRKTIYFLLAKPIPRSRIYSIKYWLNLLCLETILLLSSLALYATVIYTGKGYPAALFFQNHLLITAGTALLFSVAMYFSNLFDRTMTSFLVTGFISMLLSVPGYFAPIQKLSVFYYIQGEQIIKGSGFPYLAFALIIFAAGIFYILGQRKFVTRDW